MNSNWKPIFLIFCALLLQKAQSNPIAFNADYIDDDLVAEESRAYAMASSSASSSAGGSASASSSSFGGYGGNDQFNDYGFGPHPHCHRPPHFMPHHHQTPLAPFGAYYPPAPNPFGGGFGYPMFSNFHGSPKNPVPHSRNPQRQPPNVGTFQPGGGHKNMPQMPSTELPISSTVQQPVEPVVVPSTPATLPVVSLPSDVDMPNVSTTTEEPSYDIDIRFGNN